MRWHCCIFFFTAISWCDVNVNVMDFSSSLIRAAPDDYFHSGYIKIWLLFSLQNVSFQGPGACFIWQVLGFDSCWNQEQNTETGLELELWKGLFGADQEWGQEEKKVGYEISTEKYRLVSGENWSQVRISTTEGRSTIWRWLQGNQVYLNDERSRPGVKSWGVAGRAQRQTGVVATHSTTDVAMTTSSQEKLEQEMIPFIMIHSYLNWNAN